MYTEKSKRQRSISFRISFESANAHTHLVVPDGEPRLMELAHLVHILGDELAEVDDAVALLAI
jgi:hypothetical protein